MEDFMTRCSTVVVDSFAAHLVLTWLLISQRSPRCTWSIMLGEASGKRSVRPSSSQTIRIPTPQLCLWSLGDRNRQSATSTTNTSGRTSCLLTLSWPRTGWEWPFWPPTQRTREPKRIQHTAQTRWSSVVALLCVVVPGSQINRLLVSRGGGKLGENLRLYFL